MHLRDSSILYLEASSARGAVGRPAGRSEFANGAVVAARNAVAEALLTSGALEAVDIGRPGGRTSARALVALRATRAISEGIGGTLSAIGLTVQCRKSARRAISACVRARRGRKGPAICLSHELDTERTVKKIDK